MAGHKKTYSLNTSPMLSPRNSERYEKMETILDELKTLHSQM